MNRHAKAGRIGGLMNAATHDMRAVAKVGVNNRMARFEAQVDPDGTLEPGERRRRAESLMKAHMARLTMLRWGKARA